MPTVDNFLNSDGDLSHLLRYMPGNLETTMYAMVEDCKASCEVETLRPTILNLENCAAKIFSRFLLSVCGLGPRGMNLAKNEIEHDLLQD
jgi:hypothetical protein